MKLVKHTLLFVVIFIILYALWLILAAIGMGYEDGIRTGGISKWAYLALRHGVLFSYNFYAKIGITSVHLASLLTTSFVIICIINSVKWCKRKIEIHRLHI